MNAAEAKKIIYEQEHRLSNGQRFFTQTVSEEYKYIQAQYYLQALEGPEVKVLVEYLNRIQSADNTHCSCYNLSKIALDQYYAAVKK